MTSLITRCKKCAMYLTQQQQFKNKQLCETCEKKAENK